MQNEELKNKFRILIVDDEQDILNTIREALDSPRYHIFCQSNPEKALKQIENSAFDIVLTDLMMPVVGGIELINAVKKNNQDTQVIVITGHATINTAIESIKLGVYDYVHKPINHHDLQNLVYRASESLQLRRKNIKLQETNQRLLGSLSLLMDVSKIIYQVTDLQAVLDMIIDTITEYFEYDNCAVIMEEAQTGRFLVAAERELDFGNGFDFERPLEVNGNRLASDKETLIIVNDEKIVFGNKQKDCTNGWFLFCPVNFRDQVLGFLVVQGKNKPEPQPETIAMLNILALQTAPMIYSLNPERTRKTAGETEIAYMIRENIARAHDQLSPITFSLVRLEFYSPSSDPFSYQDMLQTARQFLQETLEDTIELVWQSQDTALLILPETDFFNAELYLKNLKQVTENQFIAKETHAGTNLYFSCLSYPEAGDTAQEITERLWAKLLQEIHNGHHDKTAKEAE